MTVTDQLVGTVFVTAAMVVFAYYTTWVVVTPLLGPKHFLQPFFLDRKLALVIPAAILAGVVAFAGLFIGYTLLKAGSKPAPSPVAAAAEGAAEGAAAGAKKAKATKRK